MLQTNLQAKFRIVNDARPEADPWGYGIVFQVARVGCPEYQKWLKRQQADSPLFRIVLGAAVKAQIKTAGVSGSSDSAAIYAAELSNAADKMDLTAKDLERMLGDSAEGVALLLRDWSGLTDAEGAEVPFSKEAALELLRSEEFVPPDQPYGGQMLGVALQRFLVEKAQESETARGVVPGAAVSRRPARSSGASARTGPGD